jgi:hypothetical protein
MTEHERETMDQYGLRVGRELGAQLQGAPTLRRRRHRTRGRGFTSSPAAAMATTALLASLFVITLLAGGTGPAPLSPAGEIAFVSATYTCADQTCALMAESDRIPGLRAENPTVMSVPGDGDEPSLLLDVPGSDRRPTGWTVTDPRSSWLAGPAVVWCSGPAVAPDRNGMSASLELGDEGLRVARNRGGAWRNAVTMSDPRLRGDAYQTYESHEYVGTGIEVVASTLSIVNEDGAWVSRRCRGTGTGADATDSGSVFIGEGTYEGLIAVMSEVGAPVSRPETIPAEYEGCGEVKGIIIDDAPVPEPYLPQ